MSIAVWLANADLWGGSKHPIIDMLCAIIFLGAYIALIIISMKKGYYRCNIWALKDKIILVVCWLLALPIGVLIDYLIVFGIFSML